MSLLQPRHKVCLYGKEGVGKRTLIMSGSRSYTPQEPVTEIRSIGMYIWNVSITRPTGHKAELDVYYAAKETTQLGLYSDGASVLVFVYSIAAVESYNWMLEQLTALEQTRRAARARPSTQAAVWVVGTHLDRASISRAVDTDRLNRLCSQFNYTGIEIDASSNQDTASKLWGPIASAMIDRDNQDAMRKMATVDITVRQPGAVARSSCQC